MADNAIPEVAIKLDKVRHLKFGLRALHALKQEMKQAPADATMANADQLAILVWACLLWEDKTLTLDAVMDIVDKNLTDLSDLRAKVNEAIALASPENKTPLAPKVETQTG